MLQGMSESLQGRLPISSRDLEDAHAQWRDHAVDTFRKISVFEEKRTYATKLEVTQAGFLHRLSIIFLQMITFHIAYVVILK